MFAQVMDQTLKRINNNSNLVRTPDKYSNAEATLLNRISRQTLG